jgi:hypothetical protein
MASHHSFRTFASLALAVVAGACLVFDGKVATLTEAGPGDASPGDAENGDASGGDANASDVRVADAPGDQGIVCGTAGLCPVTGSCCAKKPESAWSGYSCVSSKGQHICKPDYGYQCDRSFSDECPDATPYCCAERGTDGGSSGAFSYSLCRSSCGAGEPTLCRPGDKPCPSSCENAGPDLPPGYYKCE